MSNLLILGTEADSHIGRVITKLQEKGVSCTILDNAGSDKVSVGIGSDGIVKIELNGKCIETPDLIWRRIKLSAYKKRNERSYQTRKLIVEEWSEFYGFIMHHYKVPIVNRVDDKKPFLKLSQLELASKLGFNIPETFVTTERSKALEFAERFESIINKKPSGATVPRDDGSGEPEMVMTSRVKRKSIADADDDQFLLCPVFFQKEIIKAYELRIVCVGSQVLAFKVDSQDHDLSEVDWRYKTVSLEFELVDLPKDISNRLQSFLKETGLFYGSFDLMVDKSGKYWFLECNQVGQWAWLDEFSNGQVAQAFADEFYNEFLSV